MTPPTTISRALAEYLTDWLAWVDRGAPDGEPYWRRWGLCCNALFVVGEELQELFGREHFPFDTPAEHSIASITNAQHLNEARLAWCRSTLATAEIEG